MKIVQAFSEYAGDEIGLVTFSQTDPTVDYILPVRSISPVTWSNINIFAPYDISVPAEEGHVFVHIGFSVATEVQRQRGICIIGVPGSDIDVREMYVTGIGENETEEEVCIEILSNDEDYEIPKGALIAIMRVVN